MIPLKIETLLEGRVVEHDRVEYKTGWNPNDIIHSICAFANDYDNTNGGYIVIGVEEKNGMPVFPLKGVLKEKLDSIQQEIFQYCNQIIPRYIPRIEVVDYQNEETLVNAVFHKSYREPEPVEIRIYVDSIQILNYPGLAKWINLERFASGKVKGRKYRNRRIGELFKEIDLSEKKGTGIPKMLRELKQNGSPEPEFDMDEERTYLNTIIHIRAGFEIKEKMSESMSKSMSESMSELERARMQIILIYLETNKEINSSVAAKLLEVEIKTASRLLLKAEKLNILKATGKTKNKVYFRESCK